jgi:hypothetical protein
MENNVIIKTPEQQREELLAKISDFKLMDDTYMSAFFNGRREEMCKIMEDLNNESVRQEKYQTAIRLIKMNLLSAEDIAKATDLSVEDINTLIAMVRETA